MSYRDVVELMAIRGMKVDRSTIQRWVLMFSKEVERKMHKRKRSISHSWRMDETYVKVGGMYRYLYRSI
ncbi:DDE-type integrase/transposase/recombinase [Zhouia amylolytica]|uniref:DDE-type integrase/transposase/recombinase n=1 Tax=Zhouia amylolytica TaxID=376730 RepID=UPI001114319E|nr:DDE-type integrase/transposase/recombinase [Zhouia amylolytica]